MMRPETGKDCRPHDRRMGLAERPSHHSDTSARKAAPQGNHHSTPPRTPRPGRVATSVGRSPDWRVVAAGGLPMVKRPQWHVHRPLGAYSCGGSSGSPASRRRIPFCFPFGNRHELPSGDFPSRQVIPAIRCHCKVNGTRYPFLPCPALLQRKPMAGSRKLQCGIKTALTVALGPGLPH